MILSVRAGERQKTFSGSLFMAPAPENIQGSGNSR
jgi:hypothetical protein